MHRVFLIEETHLDISKLRNFGQVTYLFHRGEQRRPIRDPKLEDQIISQLARFSFDPEKDYIGIVGQQLQLVIFLSAVVSFHGQVKTLVFDAREEDYFERSMGHLGTQEFVEMS